MQISSLNGFLRYACQPCRYREAEDRIFISYRQADTLIVATNLQRLLAAEFGDANVFRDQVALPMGVRFPEAIEMWLRSSTAVLIVMGPDWLTITDHRTGGRRIDAPDDLVRKEVEVALELYPKTRVIPVLVDGAQMPAARELPPSIRHLQLHMAAQIRRDCLVEDALELIRRLRTPPPPRFLSRVELRDHPMGALVANALWRPLWSNLLLPVALLLAGLAMGASWLVAMGAVFYLVFFTVTLFDRQQVRCVEEGLDKLQQQRHGTHPSPAEPSGMA